MRISKSTIVRTVLLLMVVINMLLEKFGLNIIPIDESQVGMILESVIEFAIIIVGFWKNNSYTPEAIKADEFLKKLRESE